MFIFYLSSIIHFSENLRIIPFTEDLLIASDLFEYTRSAVDRTDVLYIFRRERMQNKCVSLITPAGVFGQKFVDLLIYNKENRTKQRDTLK